VAEGGATVEQSVSDVDLGHQFELGEEIFDLLAGTFPEEPTAFSEEASVAPKEHDPLEAFSASLRDVDALNDELISVVRKTIQPAHVSLHIFLDGSVVEVFANGRVCVTDRIYPTKRDSVGLDLFARGGTVGLSALNIWEMNEIWESVTRSSTRSGIAPYSLGR
jgi:Glycosyl hydrolases family 32 C terminal